MSFEDKPIDVVIFCPECGEQHIDEAAPDVCEDCGHQDSDHFNAGERNICGGGKREGDPHSDNGCTCDGFKAWLNPSHKTHRCKKCNHVWRPFEYPTNGVHEIITEQ